ncbi:MAG TPA: glycoside hydrolase family 13 protein, partial [Phycisphaeraceae bacterium]|nr:glycoside hydrolase family 13 protein [Phycisphaeraceae bacterium]
ADAMLPMHLMADGNHAVVTDPLEGKRHMFSVLDQSFSKIGMYSMKARDREQFAVVYDPHQGKINVLPGVFATDYDENGIFSFRETGPVPLHDPRRIDYLRAIALDPPLADLHAFTETGSDITSISVLFPDQNGHIATVPLRREIQDKKTRWSARLRFSGPRVKYRLRVEHKNGKTEQHEYTAILNPAVHTPDWAKGATWYQIFPERFDNGDKGNDPRGIGVYLKPWRSDFYAVPADEFKAWQERVRHFGGDPDKWDRAKTGSGPADGPGRNRLYNVIYDRRYGGDLQGVLNRLDYLKGLGVTAIYFNPVFEAESLHKYDTTDYRHIDDNFGPYDPEGDKNLLAKEGLSPDTWVLTSADRFFINKFLPECRKRGIRVIIDGVFNHVGREFFAFRDVREKGSKSRYADWFDVTFDKSGALQSWNAWDGKNGWLPEFRETEDGNLVKPVREYIFNITKRWLDPNGDGDPSDGVDGWRLDVPENIGDPFWIEWHEVVKSINPDAYITAEIWYDASRFLKGDMFDAQMHYPFGSALVDWINVHPGMTSDDLYARWNSAFDNDPPATQLVQQNLCASHDTDRLVSQLFNPGREFDAANRPQDNGPNYKWWRPDDVYFTMSHVALAAQATYVGSPMIFQGAEMGMWGADDPANRKPLTWPEYMPFESPDERYLPGMEQYYHTWLNLRHKWPALRYGNVQHLPTGSARTAAYLRQLNNTVLLVVLNAGDEPYHVSSHLIPPYGKDVRLIPVHVDKNKDGTDERNTLGAYCSGVWQVIYPETVFTPPARQSDAPRGTVN